MIRTCAVGRDMTKCAQSNQQSASSAQSNQPRLITPDTAPRLKTIGLLKGLSEKVTCVAWSPDGQYLATASEDKSSWVWAAGNPNPPSDLSGQPASSKSPFLRAGIASDSIIMPLQPVAKFKQISFLYPLVSWGPDGHSPRFHHL